MRKQNNLVPTSHIGSPINVKRFSDNDFVNKFAALGLIELVQAGPGYFGGVKLPLKFQEPRYVIRNPSLFVPQLASKQQFLLIGVENEPMCTGEESRPYDVKLYQIAEK